MSKNDKFFCSYLTLFVLMISFVSTLCQLEKKEYLYRGPTDCGKSLENYHQQFSEYPEDPASSINFLDSGEDCNFNEEEKFIKKLEEDYLSSDTNEKRMLLIKNHWEYWRSKTISGTRVGGRICNPQRMLSCHPTLNRCTCRTNLHLFDANQFKSYNQIVLEAFQEVQNIPYTDQNETITRCRARVNSGCLWNVPYLGFCTLPCANVGHEVHSYCVGQADDIPRCRVCNPQTDILGDGTGKNYKCIKAYAPKFQRQNGSTKKLGLSIRLIFLIKIILYFH